MCRRLLPPLLLLLTAATGRARLHVQSSAADIGPPTEQTTGGDFEGHQVLKVFIAENSTLDLLRSYQGQPGVDFWTPVSPLTPTVDVLVSPEVRPQLTGQLTQAGASYTVNIDNVQRAIDLERTTDLDDTERELLTGRSGHPLTWQAYHSLADHHRYLDFIAGNYVGLCEAFSIGQSTEGRDLKGVKCGLGKSEEAKKEIWIDGGIHAREWLSPAVVSCLAREFSQNSQNHQELMSKHVIYILPVLNPDGYEFSRKTSKTRFWRKTRSKNPGSSCIGTDPNRNFDVHWGETGTSSNPCRDNYKGPRPFSEPETKALKNFLLGRAHAMKMYISFHSYSQMLFVPFAYNGSARPADYGELLRVAEAGAQALQGASGQRYRVGQASQLLYPAAGGSDDWAKAGAGIKYSYTFELRDTGRYGFLVPPQQIEGTCREIVAAVTTMIKESGKIDRI